MNGKIKEQIEQCKTKRQVMEILKKNNIQVVRDNSDQGKYEGSKMAQGRYELFRCSDIL